MIENDLPPEGARHRRCDCGCRRCDLGIHCNGNPVCRQDPVKWLRYVRKIVEFPRPFTGTRSKPPGHYADAGLTTTDGSPDYEGVQFSDMTVVIRWRTRAKSTSVFDSFSAFWRIHGHPDYATRISFRDGYDGWLQPVTSTTRPEGDEDGEDEYSADSLTRA